MYHLCLHVYNDVFLFHSFVSLKMNEVTTSIFLMDVCSHLSAAHFSIFPASSLNILTYSSNVDTSKLCKEISLLIQLHSSSPTGTLVTIVTTISTVPFIKISDVTQVVC